MARGSKKAQEHPIVDAGMGTKMLVRETASPSGEGVTKAEMLAMLESAGASCFVKHVPKNGVLVWDSDCHPCAYFVSEGVVEIYRLDKDGRKKTFDYCGAGGCFGFQVISDTAATIASARACTDSEVIAIPKEEFFKALHGCPAFVDFIVKSLYALLVAQTNDTAASAFYASAQRVPMLLCSLAKDELAARSDSKTTARKTAGEEEGKCEGDAAAAVPEVLRTAPSDGPIVIPYDNNEIATILGISRNSVSSSISRLQSQGAIRKMRGRIQVVDFDKLEQIALMEA